MPAPLAQPTMWTRLPAILKEAAAVLGRVSVVPMASETSAKEGGGGSRNITRKNREIERASFLESAGGSGETKSAREGCFGEGVIHLERFAMTIRSDVRGAESSLTEGTSDPPLQLRTSAGD